MLKSPRPQKGLTLIELMITLAIAGVLIATATPSMSVFVQNNRAITQVNELQTSLSIARSEAITRNNYVAVCASADGSSCSGTWQDGWIVFVDHDALGTVSDDDEVLRVNGAITGGNTLSFTQTRIIYKSSGIAKKDSSGVFMLCDARGTDEALGVVVGLSGRPKIAEASDFENLVIDGEKFNLECAGEVS